MTTIHSPAPRHTARLALVSMLVLVLTAMVALAVLAAASDDPPATGVPPTVEREPATSGSGDTSTLGDWDILCFKPAYRDAPPCLRRAAPDQVTRGRLP